MDGGFSVDIYLVDDEAIVQKISDVCSRHFFENRNIEAINLAVVGGSKEDELKRSIFKSATIKFKLEYRRSI